MKISKNKYFLKNKTKLAGLGFLLFRPWEVTLPVQIPIQKEGPGRMKDLTQFYKRFNPMRNIMGNSQKNSFQVGILFTYTHKSGGFEERHSQRSSVLV